MASCTLALLAALSLLGSSTHCRSECSVDADCDVGDPCSGHFCDDGRCAYDPIPAGGACVGGTCNERGICVRCDVDAADEPNSTQGQAVDLGTISDCESLEFEGATAPTNEDWVTFRGTDSTCAVLSEVRVIAREALDVCMYWACATPGVGADACPAGATEDTAPNGAFGCCHARSLVVDPCPDSFQDSSAQVWIRVRPPAGPDCVDYELDIRF